MRVFLTSCHGILAPMLLALWLASWPLNGDAQTWSRHCIDNSLRGADGVRLADVNHDGRLDLVTPWEEAGVVRVYLHPGTAQVRQPWPAVTVGRVKSPEDAVLIDLDRDGQIDVISCCEGTTRTMYVHWAPAQDDHYLHPHRWKTEAIPATEGRAAWMFALPLAIDPGPSTDLIVGSKGPGATVGMLRIPADSRAVHRWQFRPWHQAGWIMSLQAHDLDRDGDQDLLLSDRRGPHRGVAWFENPGNTTAGTKPWQRRRLDGGDREVMFLAVGDVDRNHSAEIVCAVRRGGISLLTAGRDPRQAWSFHEIGLPQGVGTGKGVAVGDIDRDGKPDLVFSCEAATGTKSGVRWLSYTDSPRRPVWQSHEISGPRGIKFDRLELVDIDADGDLDVLTCEEREINAVLWYENPHFQRTTSKD
ncbi:MAG: VCBS repeat-containing protein [Planctomycetota bacterium]|nr:VCBS repeat-containing protein [Planctomycetota bacterium]